MSHNHYSFFCNKECSFLVLFFIPAPAVLSTELLSPLLMMLMLHIIHSLLDFAYILPPSHTATLMPCAESC